MIYADTLILVSYFAAIAILSIYSWHRGYLVYLYFRHKESRPRSKSLETLPRVTIQLPIYNEMYVVDRLVRSICQLDYPRALLEIQLLDDSTDETREIAERAVRHFAEAGFDIKHHHRRCRTGFKAGALEAGLAMAHGEYIAIFDADFLPKPDFLRRVLPHFGDPLVGMVQTRWGHINEDYSLLTKVQAIQLDGYFVIEQSARNRSRRFFSFSGTAGIWRRSAIESAGGWQHDTLTEDLDLSYRAQLNGWRFIFLPDVIAPAEVPADMNAFKSQQARWAKGHIQTCCKLLPRIMRAKIPFPIKVEAFFNLTCHINYPLLLALSILMFPFLYVRHHLSGTGWRVEMYIDFLVFCATTFSFVNFYATCERELDRHPARRLKYLPLLWAIAIGLSVNNTRAVIEGFAGKTSEFVRTPKYAIKAHADSIMSTRKNYRQTLVVQPLIELGVGVYLTAAVLYGFNVEIYSALPLLVLFQFGFLYTGTLSLLQQYNGEPITWWAGGTPRTDESDA